MEKIIRSFLLAILFVGLSGCLLGPTQSKEGQNILDALERAKKTTFSKEGATQENIAADIYQCEQDAQLYTQNMPIYVQTPFGYAIPQREMSFYSRRQQCMEAKGYIDSTERIKVGLKVRDRETKMEGEVLERTGDRFTVKFPNLTTTYSVAVFDKNFEIIK